MRSLILILVLATLPAALSAQRPPDPAIHKAAMEKLKFLAGSWSGEAVVSHGEKPITLRQTEEVQFKLGGLVLLIEGTGRDEAGKVMFNALAVVSFDPQSNSYRIRAWTGGNTVETEMKVTGNGFEWGFPIGPTTIVHRMTTDEQGRWSEISEVTTPDRHKHQAVKMLLSRTQ